MGAALERMESVLSKNTVIPKSEDGLPLVMVDGVLIEQVLINLLENAVHYTPEGSTIILSAKKQDNSVLVSVKDNGPGNLPGLEKKIFDKFYSVSRSDKQKGTGLGLAICAGIIKAHKGKIWVENEPQGGACFYFTLPLAQRIEREAKNVPNS